MVLLLTFIYKVKTFKNHTFPVLVKFLQVLEKVGNFPNKFNVQQKLETHMSIGKKVINLFFADK